ncbi:MAG: winged helix DNA-binding domain-containing protein [Polyangiales bacterium]
MSTSRRSKADRLSARALGRATLARQLLLEKAAIAPLDAISRVAGLQAQVPRPPFVGLWSRVAGFERDALHRLVHDRHAVRATLMRGTIHLVSAEDFIVMRAALAPVLSRGLKRLAGQNVAAVLRHVKKQLPATFGDVRAALAAKFPDADVYAVRMHLPVVLVPSESRWSYAGNAPFHDAETWLGRGLAEAGLEALIRRYLAAFGPASVKDAQAWSGVRSLTPVFEAMRGELRTFVDAEGRELFDLPDAPRPAEDTPAPVRLLPEYDNLLLAFADHARIIEPARRPALTTNNGIVAATFLVDGRVAGTWELSRDKAAAAIRLRPFTKLSKAALTAVSAEAEALLRWHEPDAKRFTIR